MLMQFWILFWPRKTWIVPSPWLALWNGPRPLRIIFSWGHFCFVTDQVGTKRQEYSNLDSATISISNCSRLPAEDLWLLDDDRRTVKHLAGSQYSSINVHIHFKKKEKEGIYLQCATRNISIDNDSISFKPFWSKQMMQQSKPKIQMN